MNLMARLAAIRRKLQSQDAGNIPAEQRWWCDGCSCTDEQRRICLSEPYTWRQFMEDWMSCEDESAHVATG